MKKKKTLLQQLRRLEHGDSNYEKTFGIGREAHCRSKRICT
jgi:hypothetical protein